MTVERLRVLTVLDGLLVGGSETYALSLIRVLRRRGVRWSYAGNGGPMFEAFASEACSIHAIDLSPWSLAREATRLSAERSLKMLMRSRRINLVHVHQTPSGTVAAAAARELDIPVVFTVHGMYYSPDQLRAAAEDSRALVSVSRPVSTYLSEMGLESTLIPNGVDPSVFYPQDATALRKSLGIPEETIVIVYASRLAWDKAIVCSLLMLAIRRLHEASGLDVRLIVAGDGSQSDDIRKQADEIERGSGKKLVYVVGSKKTLRDYYALGEIVVGTGRVALEGMACGKPVIAVGNHGYFGPVVPETYEQAWDCYFGDHASIGRPSVERLEGALKSLISSADKSVLQEIGERGREWALSRFSIDIVANRIEGLYRKVVEESNGKDVRR